MKGFGTGQVHKANVNSEGPVTPLAQPEHVEARQMEHPEPTAPPGHLAAEFRQVAGSVRADKPSDVSLTIARADLA